MLRDNHYQDIASEGIQSSQFHDGDAFASANIGVSYGGAMTQATGVFDGSSASFLYDLQGGNSKEWTPDEQAILDDGMIKYASETNIACYAKIAVKLNNKSVRDVALRCKWIAKSDISRRRKEDPNLTKKGKDRKEKVLDRLSTSSRIVMESGIVHSAEESSRASLLDARQVYISHIQRIGAREESAELTAIKGVYGQLIKQNDQTFDRITVNLQTDQIEENIGLLCQARGNILRILNRLSNPPPDVVKQRMPPLEVEIDRVLANWILPPLPRVDLSLNQNQNQNPAGRGLFPW